MSVARLGTDRLDELVELLAQGGVVGVPTDTVYGLAARLDVPGALDRLFAAKLRPANLPIAVLCANVDAARGLATRWPREAERLAERYWPGPLTLVVSCDPGLAALLGADSSLGVRVPADPVCAALLARTGPLAVTSANVHGAAPCTTAEELAAVFDGAGVDAVLDAGPRDGAVSTVVAVDATAPVVLREGALASGAILAAASS
jgi:L-threonylcarbamoyladenylate synthase